MARSPEGSDRPSGLTPQQQQAWFAYMRVTLRLRYELNRELQSHSDLSHSDFDVLNALADSPDQHLTVSDLALRIGWERSRLSHQLLRMERRGLIERRTDEADARVTDVLLRADGRSALRRATPSHAALVKELFFDGLDAQLLPALSTALEQIHEQIVARGSLPRPPGRQTTWAETNP